MVTILLESDDGQSNLHDVGNHSVSSREECLEFMYNSWIRAHVSSDRYEFRVYACGSEFEQFVEIGKYAVPARTNEVDIFNTSSDESIAEFAELGLFAQFQTTSDEDALFWQRFEFLNNPNNHHLLLGKWLQLINEEIPIEDLIHASTELSELSNDRIGDCVLASLLHFSKQHGKSMEMICWLVSNEGTHFLKNFDKWNDIPGYLFDSSLRIYTAMKKESSTEEFLDNFIKSSLIPTIPLPELK